MDTQLTIRREIPADRAAIFEVHRLAFGRPDEARLVDTLRGGGFARLSLVVQTQDTLVGHILFSDMAIRTDTGSIPALALAPVAVLPARQHQGIGSALIQRGLTDSRVAGHRIVIVVGEPALYRRFGFRSELATHLHSPFPPQYLMAIELEAGALNDVYGELVYPPPFAMEMP